MENRNKAKRYPKEIRDKAVRMVDEHQGEYPSQWTCIISIAEKSGMTPETLRKWVRKAEGAGEPLANGMAASERMKQLERENKELRRTNEILKSAAAFFGAELDRQQKIMVDFIDREKVRFGVEPICKVLPIASSTYYAHKSKTPSKRELRD